MKIAFLHYYHNSIFRGLEVYLNQIASKLSKNHQILSLTGPKKTTPPLFKISFIRRLFLDSASLKVTLWSIKQLPPLHKFKPDVIFALNGGWQSLILRLYSWLTSSKLIIPGQSGPGWDDRWNLFCHPDIFVCLTQRQLDWAKKATPWKNQKFALIPNGVDLKKFTPSARVQPLQLQKPIICIAAANQKSKNIDKTILAVKALKKGSLLILGKGHLNVPHHKMPQYYRACDLFTLCSQSSEAFGIVYLEALACGLPVVATDDTSRHEIVGNAGLYVKDPSDSKEYATVLQKALDKNWGNLPRLQAAKFSWRKITKKYNELFKTLRFKN